MISAFCVSQVLTNCSNLYCKPLCYVCCISQPVATVLARERVYKEKETHGGLRNEILTETILAPLSDV